MKIGIPKYFGTKIPKLLIYNKSNSQRGVYSNRCLYYVMGKTTNKQPKFLSQEIRQRRERNSFQTSRIKRIMKTRVDK